MSAERTTADRLDEVLNAVVAGDVTRSHDLDPSLAGAVERFFAADEAPEPPPGLADRLWEDLMHAQTRPVVRAPVTIAPNGAEGA